MGPSSWDDFADFFLAGLAISFLMRSFYRREDFVFIVLPGWSYSWIFLQCQDLSDLEAKHFGNQLHLAGVYLSFSQFSTGLTSLLVEFNIISEDIGIFELFLAFMRRGVFYVLFFYINKFKGDVYEPVDGGPLVVSVFTLLEFGARRAEAVVEHLDSPEKSSGADALFVMLALHKKTVTLFLK